MQEHQLTKLLQAYGLICHTIAFNELGQAIQNRVRNACNENFDNSYLSLLANCGNGFWKALQLLRKQSVQEQQNPVDDFSLMIAKELLNHTGLEQNSSILYPGKYIVPLMELGKHAGWSMSSPLGLGLHPEYGPWLAYRALIKTDKPLQKPNSSKYNLSTQSVCLSCVSTPCVDACPAHAVELDQEFNIKRCADFRIQENSTCTKKCHARNACPVGSEYRYTDEQQSYHMERALDALVAWSVNS